MMAVDRELFCSQNSLGEIEKRSGEGSGIRGSGDHSLVAGSNELTKKPS
jgi:hypothetical protein